MMSRMQDSSPAQKTFGELLRDFLFGGEENEDPAESSLSLLIFRYIFSEIPVAAINLCLKLARGILGMGPFAASSFINVKTFAITSIT
jgi:hypothetical protein